MPGDWYDSETGMLTRRDTQYLVFEPAEPKPNTKVWRVLNKRHGTLLGYVKWYALWRQYCFFPKIDAESLKTLLVRAIQKNEPEKVLVNLIENWARQELIFTAGCQGDIDDFLVQVNEEHREMLRKRRHLR
jgi:hypothetical protein